MEKRVFIVYVDNERAVQPVHHQSLFRAFSVVQYILKYTTNL